MSRRHCLRVWTGRVAGHLGCSSGKHMHSDVMDVFLSLLFQLSSMLCPAHAEAH